MSVESDALGARLRPLLPAGTAEKRMFGGLGYMLDGNMALGTTAAGDLLVRAAPDGLAELLALPGAYQLMMGSRPMQGFVAVRADAVGDAAALNAWVARGLAAARALPPK